MQEETRESKSALPRFFTLEMFMFTVTALSGLVLLWSIAVPYRNVAIMVCAGVVFTLSIVVVIRLIMDPDSVRARQSDSMLKLASQTLTCMNDGMDYKAAQKICGLLLPSTAAIAVAITDKKQILGYAGFEEAQNPSGSIIRTHATHATLADGKLRILFTPEDIGFPRESSNIKAAIIVPLVVGRNVEGTLKFYYRRAKHISETQKSIAEGFGKLLSTQMAASALEEQTQLATRMELKMLQSQINPHFLFNTINTIASLIRTDPETARKLLREFAVFYRRTLEDSADLIVFAREMEQTKRYFTFEVARFGSDRVEMEMRVKELLVVVLSLCEMDARNGWRLLSCIQSAVEKHDCAAFHHIQFTKQTEARFAAEYLFALACHSGKCDCGCSVEWSEEERDEIQKVCLEEMRGVAWIVGVALLLDCVDGERRGDGPDSEC